MTNTNIPALPAPLDSSRLYSPAEVRKWKADCAAHYDAIRAAEKSEEQAKYKAAQPHYLTDEEYHALGVERFNAQKLKDLERETAALASAQEKQKFLDSSPATVEITETNIVVFFQQVQHWASRQYSINFDDSFNMMPTLHSLTMNAPVKSTKGAK
jgi:hypothetical protein